MTKKKDPKDLLKVGRPTVYKPEFCLKVKQMFKEGFAKVEIAAAFDVNVRTMDAWAEKHPDFHRAITEDLDFSEAWWVGEGRKNLKCKDFNARLYDINMMNRFGWNKKTDSKQEVRISHEDALKELK